MGFKLNETLVIQSVDHYGIKAGKLSIGTVTLVSDDESEKDWISMDIVGRSHTHVALEPDAGWQCKVVCKDIDGVSFPDDVAKVYVWDRSQSLSFVMVDHEGQGYSFPAQAYSYSLAAFAGLVRDYFKGQENQKLATAFLPVEDVSPMFSDGVCVYEATVEEATSERNTIVLKCAVDSGGQLVGAAIGSMYAIGVGNDEEGRGMFLTVDQATDLVDSLVQFIEEAE